MVSHGNYPLIKLYPLHLKMRFITFQFASNLQSFSIEKPRNITNIAADFSQSKLRKFLQSECYNLAAPVRCESGLFKKGASYFGRLFTSGFLEYASRISSSRRSAMLVALSSVIKPCDSFKSA